MQAHDIIKPPFFLGSIEVRQKSHTERWKTAPGPHAGAPGDAFSKGLIPGEISHTKEGN